MTSFLLDDIRLAGRILVSSPGFTAVAVLTLALGIGANTAIFSVANAVLLRPLPFPDADQLVRIREEINDINLYRGRVGRIPLLNFVVHKDQFTSFDGLSGFHPASFRLMGVEDPESLAGAWTTEDFFPLLGVQPALGRLLQPEDMQQEAHVVVLSDALWRRQFGGEPSILGREVRLNNESFTVVGVLPADFRSPGLDYSPEVWAPITLFAYYERGVPIYTFGRLREDVTQEAAYTELDLYRRRINPPEPNGKWPPLTLRTMHEDMVYTVRSGILLLLAATGCVLLIACANVANLLLSRGMKRRSEMAVRAALGAGRWRLARQMLTESFLLAAAGCVAGILLAQWLVRWVTTISFQEIPRAELISFDPQVALFAVALSVLVALASGSLPALSVSRVHINETLKQGTPQGGVGGMTRLVRNGLVIAEIAVSFVLVVGAGLMVNTFIRLNNLELNLDPRNVLTITLDRPQSASGSPETTVAFYDAAVESVRSLPGVEAVGATDFLLPNRTYGMQRYRLPGEQYPQIGDAPHAGQRYSNPGFFRALRIPVLEGRVFNDGDRFRSDRLLVINETMARALWPGDSAVGKQIVLFEGPELRQEVAAEVIGVVANIGSPALTGEPAKPRIYKDYHQTAFGVNRLLIRTSVDPLSLIASVKQAVRTVDRNQAFREVLTLEQHIVSFREYAEPRFYTALLGAFGGLALVLAAVGLFGVMGFSVARRSREFGLRIALGARPRVVLRQVLGEAAKLVTAGLALGLAGALVAARVLSSLLYEISPTDTLTYVCVALVLTAAAFAACYIPARRATQVDPMQVLRFE